MKGAAEILDKISEIVGIQPEECSEDGKFPDCLPLYRRLWLGPVLTINEEVYGRVTADDVPGILEKYQ